MSMPTYHITIADKIKAYRNENNLSLKEFGKLIGVSAQKIFISATSAYFKEIVCCTI